MEDTARAPQPPTNKPTGHQATGHQKNQQGLYVPRKAYFGPNLVVFGPKNLIILTGGSQSCGTPITENHLGTLFALFFGRTWDQVDHIGQYLTQND